MKETDREEQCQKKKEAGEREGRKKRRQFLWRARARVGSDRSAGRALAFIMPHFQILKHNQHVCARPANLNTRHKPL